MGYFALNMEGIETAEGLVKSAIANLELFLDEPDYDYLLTTFAIPYLQRAAELASNSSEGK